MRSAYSVMPKRSKISLPEIAKVLTMTKAMSTERKAIDFTVSLLLSAVKPKKDRRIGDGIHYGKKAHEHGDGMNDQLFHIIPLKI